MRVNLVKEKINEVLPKTDGAKTEGMLDLIIAFDTTGSMRSYIEAVKKHVTKLIPKLFESNPNLKIGIIAFGDYCDMASRTVFGRAYQQLALTQNQDAIIDFITSAKNTAGGDDDEFYELVIAKIIAETNWRKRAEKAVMLIGDANPHAVGYTYSGKIDNNQINWRTEASNAAALGIKFDTLRINERTPWFAELSKITNGISLPFKNDAKTDQVIYAATLARGGEVTREKFMTVQASVIEDAEMSAVYSTYSKIIMS